MSNLFQDKMSALENALKQELHYDESSATFAIDDLLYSFSFVENSGELIMYAAIAHTESVTEFAKAKMYKELVKAQYCFQKTGGFSFGVDPDEKMINFQTLYNLVTLDDRSFVVSVELFVNLATEWSKILEKIQDEALIEEDSIEFDEPTNSLPSSNEFIIQG